jgi:2,3-diketo-5-methylthio-1-phosphopentane phosphatase
MEQIRPPSVLRTSTRPEFFVSIDFDGTAADTDITDAVIKEFASAQWEDIEFLWENGVIGSRECLTRQMALINAPLSEILSFVRGFSVNGSFPGFVEFLSARRIPFGIISDGFQPFIECLFDKAGLQRVPVYANRLIESFKGLRADFPYFNGLCSSGTCKCRTAEASSGGLPVIHIGDGRSDFCIAEKAAYVFTRGKLTEYCGSKLIPHAAFTDFTTIERNLKKMFLDNNPLPRRQTCAGHIWEKV